MRKILRGNKGLRTSETLIIAIVITAIIAGAVGYSLAQRGGTEVKRKTVNWKKKYAGEKITVLMKQGYEKTGATKYENIFERQTGIDVKIQVVSEKALRDKFATCATSKKGTYDVVAVQFWSLPEFVRAGWLQPLNEYVQENASPWLFMPGVTPKARDIWTVDGNLYGIPSSFSSGMLNYRTDVFNKLGLEEPETVRDVVRAAKRINAYIEENGPIENVKYACAGRTSASFASFGTSAGWAWGWGAKVLSDTGEVTVNTQKMQTAMENFVYLHGAEHLGPPGAGGQGWAEISEMYRKGLIAMNFDMSGFPSVYTTPGISKVSNVTAATPIKGPTGNYLQWLYSQGMAINKYSDSKGAAWLFIQWRNSIRNYLREARDGIRMDMPQQAVWSLPAYYDYLKKRNGVEMRREMGIAWKNATREYWPFVPEFREIANAFQSQMSLALSGDKSVEAALSSAQKEIEDIMAK